MKVWPKERGFTLVELLVVIAIIGILASIVSVSLISSRAKGRDAKRISDVRTLQLALETYYNDNLVYPLVLSTLVTGGYITTLPVDPKDNVTPYAYHAAGGPPFTGDGRSNCSTVPAVSYHLGAAFEDATNPGLKQDANQVALWSASLRPCIGGAYSPGGFNGKGVLGSAANGTPICAAGTDVAVGVTSQCYDLIP